MVLTLLSLFQLLTAGHLGFFVYDLPSQLFLGFSFLIKKGKVFFTQQSIFSGIPFSQKEFFSCPQTNMRKNMRKNMRRSRRSRRSRRLRRSRRWPTCKLATSEGHLCWSHEECLPAFEDKKSMKMRNMMMKIIIMMLLVNLHHGDQFVKLLNNNL